MSVVRAEIVLPQDYCQDRGYPFVEFATPRPLELVERDVYGDRALFKCSLAHAFVGAVKDVRVFGPGFVVTDDGHCLLHGLSHGNYPQILESQLQGYLVGKISASVVELEIPDAAPATADEAVLLWGGRNFGHWFFTYLHRLAALSLHPELEDKKILVLDATPERFLPWLARMGIAQERLVRAQDCARIARLWIPSVVHYRGHYTDSGTYVFPEAVRLFRERILRPREARAPGAGKRERIYLSRARANWRRALNEDELVARLEKLDVRRVFMEELTVDQQVDVISRAELIVLATGAVSPITMLAPPDAAIVEMCLPGF
jgi:capsular polysaccharide biosynthesis protein